MEPIVLWVGAGLSRASGIDWSIPDDLFQRYLEQPQRVRDLYLEWEKRAGQCAPGEGHHLIAQIQQRRPKTRIITLNQDGLLQRAGCREVLEMHGRWGEWHGGRPAVIWTGEPYPQERIDRALEWLRSCRLCLVVGTSSEQEPLAQFPLEARKSGARLVEVNPNSTPLSEHCDECYREPAEQALKRWL